LYDRLSAPPVDQLDAPREPIEIDQLQELGQVDLREEFFDLLLPQNLRQLLSAHFPAQLVHVGQPLDRARPHVGGKRVVRAKRFEQRVRQERSERVLREFATSQLGHGGFLQAPFKPRTPTMTRIRRQTPRTAVRGLDRFAIAITRGSAAAMPSRAAARG
jgi:hypothetical protein